MTPTTYKQSQRLIRAGIDVNTSDFFSDGLKVYYGNLSAIEDDFVRSSVYPVWSTEALYNILPFCIHSDLDNKDFYKEISCVDNIGYASYQKVGALYKIDYYHIELEGDLTENLVSMIEWWLNGAKQDEKIQNP